MMENTVVLANSHVVLISITSNCNTFTSEKKFDKGITVRALKDKLELITGARSGLMSLELFDQYDKKVCDLSDDAALIGSYPIEPAGMRLHVTDPERKLGELEDTTGVAKYEMSKEEYSKRTGTVQDFLKKNKLGKYNEEERKRLEAEQVQQEKEEKEAMEAVKIGSRCEVRVPGNPPRRGEVAFVGKVHFKPGYWVGVKFDEPFGKNDGSVEGKRYFQCSPKYGGFVKVQNVTVGDFPEEGFSDDEM